MDKISMQSIEKHVFLIHFARPLDDDFLQVVHVVRVDALRALREQEVRLLLREPELHELADGHLALRL